MQLFDPSTLATGGMVAALIGFWGQVKNVIRQLSSIVVMQATIDTAIEIPVRRYLKSHFKQAPTGLFHYIGYWFDVPNRSRQLLVPFRLPDAAWPLFYRDRQLVFFKGRRLVTLRGLCDIDALIAAAIDWNDTSTEADAARTTRYSIYKVMGNEKGPWATGGNRGVDTPQSITRVPGGTNEPSSDSRPQVDYDLEPSFKYPDQHYLESREVDPFAALYYPAAVMAHIQQAKDWFAMGDWYQQRTIPWRRGWAIWGPGGTGKSSLGKALAQTLRIPIYEYYLSTLSDQEFLREWRTMITPCVVLFEDFDTVFDRRTNLTEHRSLSFDTVLNALSGVDSMSGVFLIVTTNHLEKIDPAMGVSSELGTISTRPGRIDTVIHLGEIDELNRRKMAGRILHDWPDEIDDLVATKASVTPAQFQEMCLQRAFARLNGAAAVPTSRPRLELVQGASA